MKTPTVLRLLALPPLAGMLLVAGCYVSSVPIAPLSEALFERSYIGDWEVVESGKQAGTVIIRNIDSTQYYVEHRSGDDDPLRMAGYLVEVKGRHFANLRELSEEAALKEQYLLVRIAIEDGKLSLRHLNEEFFEGKSIASSDELRKLIEENLDNDQMYNEHGVLTRMKKES